MLLCGCQSVEEHQSNTTASIPVQYPETAKIETQQVYFGDTLIDPYQWLEDDLSKDTDAWVKQQNKTTQNYLEQIPYRQPIKNRLEALLDYESYSAPTNIADYQYFRKNSGLQNQSVVFRQKKGSNEAEVFLDPNKFSDEGTTVLKDMSFTEDGSLVACLLSEGGSDWSKIMTLNTQTKEIVEDTIRDVKFTRIAWKGNEGFFYSAYQQPVAGSVLSGKTQNHQLWFHKIGTPQSKDKLIFGDPQNPRRYTTGRTTEDQKWLVVEASNTTKGNELYIKDLTATNAAFIPIVNNYQNDHIIVHSAGNWLYLLTNLEAPNWRLVKFNIQKPNPENWVEIIPESNQPLSVTMAAGSIFVSHMKDALDEVAQYDLDGVKVRDIELPGLGNLGYISGKWKDQQVYYSFTNYLIPNSLYQYNPQTGISTLYKQPDIDFEPSGYVSKQVFYHSKDGTRVPMMITHKKGLTFDGNNPALLYGYGGFNISIQPSFRATRVVWLENGGILAVPNLRGGGEYGNEWHKAGTKMNKQNVFDDFIAAAEYLIQEKYTSPSQLCIQGGSNGGLLVGAAMTQRPELFRVALPAVGVLDMLKYHLFTAGAGWAYDYGTAEDSKEMYAYLKGYSPYHNIIPGKEYPATMVTTADHDDRVVPAHSFKFAAKLQEAQAGPLPALIRIETNVGHGAGAPISKIIEAQADIYAFSFFNLNHPVIYLEQ